MQQKIHISFSEKVVQRTLPNYLQSSIKKHSEINLDDTKALILLDFEMLLQITGHQYFNLTLDIVVSQKINTRKSRHQQNSTRNNFAKTNNNDDSTIKCCLYSGAHKFASCKYFSINKFNRKERNVREIKKLRYKI